MPNPCINQYINDLNAQFQTGVAHEYAYRCSMS